MHFFTFIAVSFAVVLAVSAVPVEEDLPHNDFYSQTQQCVANSHFVDKCNVCFCGPDGKALWCTLKGCQEPEKPHIDGFTSTEGLSCVPGKTFNDNCKSCTCGKSGKTALCTLEADCPVNVRSRRSVEAVRPKIHIDNFSETLVCTPGQQFYNQCNSCHCAADGKSAACNLQLCPEYNEIRIDNFSEVQKCPAGKTFFDKCNSCTCNADGASAFCTLAACPEYE